MAQGVHKITEDFEKKFSDYTGAKYVVTIDNQSNSLFLASYYEKNITEPGVHTGVPSKKLIK